MFGRKKKKNQQVQGVVELTAQEADAIIASGSSNHIAKEEFYHDYDQNYQMKMTLNKLHGK